MMNNSVKCPMSHSKITILCNLFVLTVNISVLINQKYIT